ncbi:hypothetical protein GIY56_14465 [Paracoccus sp. YIM 132242]|uniref:Tetratricopeptide repeat protein n=1 Tax=Paracoccus lichenicola TaxID=2665644 RepID=A0A6L6HSU5_9RHOB|nr:hypothetical protein [Paracoccus lichenicola]MTE01489.1 hypothetical protein [Paracoccus lichenicola]
MPDVMRTVVLASLALCGGAMAGVMALRPDPAVRLEAELSRLEPEDALRELRGAEGRIAFHDNLELLYGRLSLADGDLDRARRSFRRLQAQASPSEEVLETLAGIEAAAGDLAAAAAFLRQAQDAFPSADRRLRLGGWYQALRQPEAERDLLLSEDPTVLTPGEIDRLGLLLIRDGRIADYEALFTTLADSTAEGHLSFKRRLLEFLVESGRPAEAVAAAARWTAGPQGAAALEASVRALIGRGAIDAAILVARDGFRLAPGDSHVALPVFARSGHGGVARLLQGEWLASRPTLSDAEWATLTHLAESTGDMRGLQVALASGGGQAGAPALGQALMQFVRYRGAGALVPWRGLLSEDVFKEVPLVGAAWANWRGDRPATYRHLVAASNQPLSDWDQLIWMSLLDGLRGSPFHRVLLAGAVDHPGLRQRLRDSVIPARPARAALSASPDKPG